MKQQFPDYENGIANLANSILEEFGIDEGRHKLKALEQYLHKDYENIVILLLDGMGENIIEKNLRRDKKTMQPAGEKVYLWLLERTG